MQKTLYRQYNAIRLIWPTLFYLPSFVGHLRLGGTLTCYFYKVFFFYLHSSCSTLFTLKSCKLCCIQLSCFVFGMEKFFFLFFYNLSMLTLELPSVAGFEKKGKEQQIWRIIFSCRFLQNYRKNLVDYLSQLFFNNLQQTHTHTSPPPCLHTCINGFVISLVMAPHAIN